MEMNKKRKTNIKNENIPIQVNSKGGYSHDWLLNPDKLVQIGHWSIVHLLYYQPSSNSQVSIKPSVPQTTTIRLHTYFKITSFCYLKEKKWACPPYQLNLNHLWLRLSLGIMLITNACKTSKPAKRMFKFD